MLEGIEHAVSARLRGLPDNVGICAVLLDYVRFCWHFARHSAHGDHDSATYEL